MSSPAPPDTGGLLARNTAWNLGGQLLPLGVALLAMPALVRGLGAPAFGLLGLIWMVLTFFRELGFGRATTKLVAELAAREEPERAAFTVWIAAAVQAVLGVLAGLALVALADPIGRHVLRMPAELLEETRLALLLVGASVPPVMVAGAFRGALEGLERFDLTNLVMAPLGLANFLLPLLALALGWGLPGVVALLAGARVGALAALAALSLARLPELRRPRGDPGDTGRLIRFGGWTSVSTVISPMLMYADRALIGVLVGVAAVGYYTAPFEAATRLLVLPLSMVAALFPALSGRVGHAGIAEAGRLATRSVKLLLLVMGPAAIVLAASADSLLRLWLGADFAAAGALALRILAAGVLVNALAHVPFSLLQGVGRPDLTAKLHAAELPLHLALAWVLVGRWGIVGAALAWTVRVSVDAAALFYLSRRVSPGLNWRTDRLSGAAFLVLLCGVAATALVTLVPGEWPRLAALGALLVFSGVLAWRFGLGDQERASFALLFGGARAP